MGFSKAWIRAQAETGAGEIIEGEGAISLARAFQTAGTRDVVATLWRVPDASTAVLVHRFHAGLLDRRSVDEALRQAQLALIKGPTGVPPLPDEGLVASARRWLGRDTTVDARHPYFWAAFQAIGTGEAIF